MENEQPRSVFVQRLFMQHAAQLRGFILGLLAQRDEANDVFQDVFLTVLKQADDFRPDNSFLGWVRGIARNKVLEHFRRQSRSPRPFDSALVEVLADSAGQEDDILEERRAALAACIDQLAPRARQILEMRYADSPTAPPAIAERLAWTVNAVHVALARARKFLHDCTRGRLAAKEA